MNVPVKYFCLLTAAFLLSSCTGGGGSISVKKQAAQSAVDIMELTDEYVLATEQAMYELKHKAEQLNVLTNGTAFPQSGFEKETTELTMDLKKAKQLLATYSALYKSYYKIEGMGLSKEQADFTQVAKACIVVLKNLNTNQRAYTELEAGLDGYKSSRYQIMYTLNQDFTATLKRYLKNTKAYMTIYYEQYAEGLDGVPQSKFDTVKVKQVVNEPYSDKEVLIELYKLKLEDEVYAKTQVLNNRARLITDLLEELNLLHAEYLKRNYSSGDIKKHLLRINELSGQY